MYLCIVRSQKEDHLIFRQKLMLSEGCIHLSYSKYGHNGAYQGHTVNIQSKSKCFTVALYKKSGDTLLQSCLVGKS